jgi:hypothetical protein
MLASAAQTLVCILVKQVGQLPDNSATKLVNICNGNGVPVIACNIMANTNGKQFNR